MFEGEGDGAGRFCCGTRCARAMLPTRSLLHVFCFLFFSLCCFFFFFFWIFWRAAASALIAAPPVPSDQNAVQEFTFTRDCSIPRSATNFNMSRVLRPSFALPPSHLPRPSRSNWNSISSTTPPTCTNTFRLAPSDFAFLFDECKRCFYLKVHRKLARPRAPFPTIFGTIDTAMKKHFRGLRTEDIVPQMPPGTFLCEENDAWVECTPISPPGYEHRVYIRGMVGCMLVCSFFWQAVLFWSDV